MESTDEDAGAATNASRRASAREKDVGENEDGGTSSEAPLEQREGSAPSETTSINEECFDGDSVPSPSTHDVNTSTEALLDMIDEIVDGPRRSLTQDDVSTPTTSDQTECEPGPPRLESVDFPSQPPVILSADIAKSEIVSQDSIVDTQFEVATRSDTPEKTFECITQSVTSLDNVEIIIKSSRLLENVEISEQSNAPANIVECMTQSDNLFETIECTSQNDILTDIAKCTKQDIPTEIIGSMTNSATPAEIIEHTQSEPPAELVECSSQSDAPAEVVECTTQSHAPVEIEPCSTQKVVPAENVECLTRCDVSAETVECLTQSNTPVENVDCVSQNVTPADSVACPTQADKQTEMVPYTIQSDTPAVTVSLETLQTSSPVSGNEAAVSTSPEECIAGCSVSETSRDCPTVNIPSSSIVETVQIVSDSSESDKCDRTLKCVTSSDSQDNMAVKNVEPTSSDSSVSECSAAVTESATRSPLRRRLVRPAPSERRPDSTVSSTVDSQTVNIHTNVQTSENVAKDVSSSSDIVSPVHVNIKLDEISVSEVSVCKAETSASSKKIKLVRHRLPASHRDNKLDQAIHIPVTEMCQSTSGSVPSVLDIPETPIRSNITLPESIKPDLIECVSKVSVPQNSEPDNKSKEETDNFQEKQVQVKSEASSDLSERTTQAIPENTEKISDHIKVPSIKLNLNMAELSETSIKAQVEKDNTKHIGESSSLIQPSPIESDCHKQVPKLTIKLGNIQTEEMKSPIPKLTIKPLRPPENQKEQDSDLKIPSVTKINIKPIPKPAEKINDIHRKSSSSEISESESSENDDSASTSDQTSTSDQGHTDVVPKVTIKLGKPGTDCEGKFYTEKNAPKLTIKNIQPNENMEQEVSKHKLVISQSEDKQTEKIPKLTIKTVTKSDGQPLSPKLTKRLVKPAETFKDSIEPESSPHVPKIKISTEPISSTTEVENFNVPKITIKPVTKMDYEPASRTPKKSAVVCDSPEHIPVVTKLNIKPVIKPSECSEILDNEDQKIPLVSKLNIKPIMKPADRGQNLEEIEGNVPTVSRLTIKPILKPDVNQAVETKDENIPIVSKLTIKPILKPVEFEETSQSNVPIVSKINIKPIVKPIEMGETPDRDEEKVPVVSKLNIKPIVKPKDMDVNDSIDNIPKITKLNIKPLKNPEVTSSEVKDCDESNAEPEKNSIPIVTKINIKPIVKPAEETTFKDSENQSSETGNSSDDNTDHLPTVTKLNIKPIIKPNTEECTSLKADEENIPVVTKLNIKRLVKPEEYKSPMSPKKDSLRIADIKRSGSPVVTKLTIKPIIKPEEIDLKINENEEGKNPPLVMKINRKAISDSSQSDSLCNTVGNANNVDDVSDYVCNNINEDIPVVSKLNIKPVMKPASIKHQSQETPVNLVDEVIVNCKTSNSPNLSSIDTNKQNCVLEVTKDVSAESPMEPVTINVHEQNQPRHSFLSQKHNDTKSNSSKGANTQNKPEALRPAHSETMKFVNASTANTAPSMEITTSQTPTRTQNPFQNCTLLKKLLESKKDGLDNRLDEAKINHSPSSRTISTPPIYSDTNCEMKAEDLTIKPGLDNKSSKGLSKDQMNDIVSPITIKLSCLQDLSRERGESVTKPLEINVTEKITNQSSGQDSPRIILKINKTDHGSSAKIITEEVKRPETPQQNDTSENTQDIVNDKQKKNIVNSRKKPVVDMSSSVPVGKRLRSSRIVESAGKSPVIKRNIGKRQSESTSPQGKELGLSLLETKRLKLGELLSNTSLTVTPITVKPVQVLPTKSNLETRQGDKMVNHSHLNNENCSKNGNSKLHNILSNLQAKQAKALNDLNCSEKKSIIPELESNTSTGSSDVVEIIPIENSLPEVQEMIINENSESRGFNTCSDELSQDPLDVSKANTVSVVESELPSIPKAVDLTPQPKKRGRPRKIPLSEGGKPLTTPIVLPVPALEERPQRSLRLSRDRPAILAKPRGRGRGRGAKRPPPCPPKEPETIVETANKLFAEEEKPIEEVDPTSSRIKLPRMTEALDKMPSVCSTPLSSRRRISSTDLKLFETPELKVVLEKSLPKMEEILRSPETPTGRGGRGGRGSRGGRGRGAGRTPRGRGRGRGGGRGAMYMKETMGIYGRVCGPATTTVQLFEEETCMMDDNATPAKPSHLLDEDSQSSVKSSTNESSKMKKSKFADLFDSNKVWTAADVKEYKWPPPETPDVEHQVMMIQEQVAMFLGVKSFKRRYPELKRRPVAGEERDYLLSKEMVTEALCDLGITAVDASEVLDIMLSDYPHKYEEYRSHQRSKQIAEAAQEEAALEAKPEVRVERVEMKVEMKPAEPKPEVPKIDLEKSRQDQAAAAIASASEWNTRLNALRRPACVDMQTMTIHRRRAPVRAPPAPHVRPPAGFYPHALLPGQYQHSYRTYLPGQLRYFPLNTALAAPPAPPSPHPTSSDSEPDWGSSSGSDNSSSEKVPAKRKKLTKTKRSSQPEGVKEEKMEPEDTCRACSLRLEANRKYTHERFLVCAHCSAKLHPGCVDLSADTIRKCREYAWQCAECKSCCACRRPQDDDKMLFCDLCDRGFHIYCVGLDKVPSGRWHCVECAICKSCGSREPSGPLPSSSSGPGTSFSGSVTPDGGAEWHHQTRRGPGGHKVYSHSLCTPCARAKRIGRYCPLCERSFIGPKGTMQLVICKLCDRQHHQDCVKQTVSNLNVLDYTCNECRRGGITSRAAAARLAPRTIATLFMAKRRFNKYAHRQYMQSRLQERTKPSIASENSEDVPEDTIDAQESCDRPDRTDDASDMSEAASDPLEGAGDPAQDEAAGDPAHDEAATAVQALRMDFGD